MPQGRKYREIFMKDSMKITVPYQFGQVLLTHLGAAVIAFTFQSVAFWYFIERMVFKEILGVVFTLIYAGMIYQKVDFMSVRDHREYTPLKPSLVKGVMFGVLTAAVTFVLFLLWKYAWTYSVNDGGLTGVWAHIVNVVFVVWTFPFYGLMHADHGTVSVVGMIAMFAVPIAASTLGYISGKRGINLADIIQRAAYEKEED